MNKKTEKNTDGLQEVQLITRHVHAGKMYHTGEIIRVNQPMKDWLLAHGVISPTIEPKLTLTSTED
jgi:flagellar biosynthesis regulator FlbT